MKKTILLLLLIGAILLPLSPKAEARWVYYHRDSYYHPYWHHRYWHHGYWYAGMWHAGFWGFYPAPGVIIAN